MQFNTYIFIMLFLPITLLLYFLGNRINKNIGKFVLIIASIFFYTYSGWSTILVLGISLIANYSFAQIIQRVKTWHKLFLSIPIIINVGLLLYFKYLNFTIVNINTLFATDIVLKQLALPLGISFFTFQQIAYIVAVYRQEISSCSVDDYLAYILYFPKISDSY